MLMTTDMGVSTVGICCGLIYAANVVVWKSNVKGLLVHGKNGKNGGGALVGEKKKKEKKEKKEKKDGSAGSDSSVDSILGATKRVTRSKVR